MNKQTPTIAKVPLRVQGIAGYSVENDAKTTTDEPRVKYGSEKQKSTV